MASGTTHVLLELKDHLGSTTIAIDQATSELVESSTYLGYGGADSDYRPVAWGSFREDYRFTGKEEDVEVGLDYFGKRYYAPLLGRWVSADPLAIHSPGNADLNVYAYVHGRLLSASDPFGLDDGAAPPGPAANLPVATNAFRGGIVPADVGANLGLPSGQMMTAPTWTSQTASYKYYPTVNSDQEVLFYTAVTRGTKQADFVMSPDALTSFMSKDLSMAAMGAIYRMGGVSPQETESSTVVFCAVTGDLSGALAHLAQAWKAAAKDPSWWLQAATATLVRFAPVQAEAGAAKGGGGGAGGGRGSNNLKPDPTAGGDHATFKTDPQGNVTNYVEWESNPQNPSGFDEAKRVDVTGGSHFNKATGQRVVTPHVHEPGVPGGVRPALPEEVP